MDLPTWNSLVNWAEEEAEDGLKDIVAFFKASAEAIFANGGQLLLSSALQAVETVEQDTSLSGSEKFTSATEAVIGTLESAGISILLSAVQAGVQAAYLQMQANLAAETAKLNAS